MKDKNSPGKKTETETENETRAKKPARNQKDIFETKVESAGGIVLKQIDKLKSAQQNAIKSGSVKTFNKVLKHLAGKLEGLELDEDAKAEKKDAPSTFKLADLDE